MTYVVGLNNLEIDLGRLQQNFILWIGLGLNKIFGIGLGLKNLRFGRDLNKNFRFRPREFNKNFRVRLRPQKFRVWSRPQQKIFFQIM